MRSLGNTSRGAVNGVKETVGEYKGWLILGAAGYLLYKFNGLFSALGDTASSAVEAATAEARAKAEASAAASKVKADAQLSKAKVSVLAPNATDAQIAQYTADAEALVGHLGTKKGVWTRQSFFANSDAAFGLIKGKYSRLLLHNNAPYDSKTLKSQSAETATSAKRKINASVLQPFYSDLTGGRNLVADMKDSCSASRFQPVLKWIL